MVSDFIKVLTRYDPSTGLYVANMPLPDIGVVINATGDTEKQAERHVWAKYHHNYPQHELRYLGGEVLIDLPIIEYSYVSCIDEMFVPTSDAPADGSYISMRLPMFYSVECYFPIPYAITVLLTKENFKNANNLDAVSFSLGESNGYDIQDNDVLRIMYTNGMLISKNLRTHKVVRQKPDDVEAEFNFITFLMQVDTAKIKAKPAYLDKEI